MRHAEAEANAQDDHGRRLTAQGKIDSAIMASVLIATGWKFGQILSSSLIRAQETRDILAETLRPKNALRSDCLVGIEPRLGPGFAGSVAKAHDLLSNKGASHYCVWIFHAPDVSQVASYFTGMPAENYYFTPGAMLALNIQVNKRPYQGMQIWHKQPEYMRKVFAGLQAQKGG